MRHFGIAFRRARSQVENTFRDLGEYLPLYKAAVRGEWRNARKFFDEDPEALTAKITIASETALHIAVGTGKAIKFVEKLVREMTTENLALTDLHGETALSIAAAVGNIEAAKILVNKNPDLPNISGKYVFPIHKAARFGHKGMVLYLMDVTRHDILTNPFVGEVGGRLLIDVIAADFYDVALDLVNRFPETATVELNGLGSPLSVLARKSTAFSSSQAATPATSWSYPLFTDLSRFREGMKRKVIENQARELARALCKEILELDDSRVFSLLRGPLHDAAKLGIPEIIEEVVEAFPPAIWFTDENNYNVFQLAVLNRREHVFNLIYQMSSFRFLITSCHDQQDNNMLHLVARLPPSERIHLVSGPAFLMQREMQWFEEVKRFVQPAQRVAKNKDNETPDMVFRKEHQELMKQGVKWTKQTTTSSTVFATLIATVAFTGGMHVPEGITNGPPVLMYKLALIIFVTADAISLILSVVSIIIFLSIIISRHSEVKFLSSCPWWLYIGLSILLTSITTMLIAFTVALFVLLNPTNAKHHIPWGLWVISFMLLVAFTPLLLPVIWFISERKLFGKKSPGILH
ncbi:hypothetical protein KSS87_012249 [Heliosperma pusillum]|nr:hypothetical protein KSS87_012249 [Heliosperma pusillum]